MTIPKRDDLLRPVLEFASDGAEKTVQDCVRAMARRFDLTPEELEQMQPAGGQPLFANRVRWVQFDLKKAGAIESTGLGRFRITERGKALLRDNAGSVTSKQLRQLTSDVVDSVDDQHRGISDAAETPEEVIQKSLSEIDARVQRELLEQIRLKDDKFFERLVAYLVGKIYDLSPERIVRANGGPGDGGIDAVIDQDELGLDTIYIQAKKWRDPVARDTIQKFVGALADQKGAKKGIVITASTFAKSAQEYASRQQNYRIVLIDGAELTRLMIKHSVGVRRERILPINKLDVDFFDSEEI